MQADDTEQRLTGNNISTTPDTQWNQPKLAESFAQRKRRQWWETSIHHHYHLCGKNVLQLHHKTSCENSNKPKTTLEPKPFRNVCLLAKKINIRLYCDYTSDLNITPTFLMIYNKISQPVRLPWLFYQSRHLKGKLTHLIPCPVVSFQTRMTFFFLLQWM